MRALTVLALLDELWSGVAVVAAPAIEAEQGMGHREYALLVFTLRTPGGLVDSTRDIIEKMQHLRR